MARDRVSERRACRVIGQPRSTQRRELGSMYLTDEPKVAQAYDVDLATEYGRYGYRRVTALLKREKVGK